MANSSRLSNSVLNPHSALPERFGDAPNGWRGVPVAEMLVPYLEGVYTNYPQTFNGLRYMDQQERLLACRMLGEVLWELYRTTLVEVTYDYLQRVRGDIHDISTQGLRLSWLSCHVEVVVLRRQFVEARRRRRVAERWLEEATEAFRKARVEMVTTAGERRRRGMPRTPEWEARGERLQEVVNRREAEWREAKEGAARALLVDQRAEAGLVTDGITGETLAGQGLFTE